jgi:hypothetical protein
MEHINGVSQEVLADALNATLPRIAGSHYRGFLIGNGNVSSVSPDAMGVNPVWREMTYHLIVNAVPGDTRHDFSVAPLAKIAPTAGAYINEVSIPMSVLV